jgi:hypothetical protein
MLRGTVSHQGLAHQINRVGVAGYAVRRRVDDPHHSLRAEVGFRARAISSGSIVALTLTCSGTGS